MHRKMPPLAAAAELVQGGTEFLPGFSLSGWATARQAAQVVTAESQLLAETAVD